MKLALLVTAAPGTPAAVNALEFSRSALLGEHQVVRVFFSQSGAAHANTDLPLLSGQIDTGAGWGDLSEEHGLDLVVCVGSAQRHGIDAGKQAGVKPANLRAGFCISGLGQLVEACLSAERVISFG